MLSDLSYSTISRVIETWERARRSKDFEEYVGTIVLLKMFEYEPKTKEVFNITLDYQPSPQELKDSGNLQIAISIIQRLDACLNLLGPDAELVTEILNDLGKRHVNYGVKAQFMPFMGKALEFALKEKLGDKWNTEAEESWRIVYDEISGVMMRGILSN